MTIVGERVAAHGHLYQRLPAGFSWQGNCLRWMALRFHCDEQSVKAFAILWCHHRWTTTNTAPVFS